MRSTLIATILMLIITSCRLSTSDKVINKEIESINDVKYDTEQLIGLFQSTKDSSYLLKAEKNLDSLIDKGIKDIKLYQLKSRILRDRKQYNKFAEFMRESTKCFPDNPQTYFGTGMAYDNIEEYEQAKEMYKKSIDSYDRLISKYPTIDNYVNRAMAYGFLNGKEASLKEFEAIYQSGKFDKSSVEIYRGMFLNFDKSKLLNSASRNP